MFYRLRLKQVQPKVFGRVLDVGCGRKAVNGAFGVELPRGGRPSVFTQGFQNLPFMSDSFNTVILMATLNYIPDKDRVVCLKEVHRVTRKYGRLVITCTTKLGGGLHRLLRPLQPSGISQKGMKDLVKSCGYSLVYSKPFMFGLNRVYVFGREEVRTDSLIEIQKIIKEEIHRENNSH